MLQLRIFIYVLFCQECRDYALFDVEFYAEFLEEILRNTQNFGRNSAEKIGRWSLCTEMQCITFEIATRVHPVLPQSHCVFVIVYIFIKWFHKKNI